MHRLVFTLLVGALGSMSAQSWMWTADGGGAADDEIEALSVDSGGSIFAVGTQVRDGCRQVGTVKLRSDGAHQWSVLYDPFPGFAQVGVDIHSAQPYGALVLAASQDSQGIWCYAAIRYLQDGQVGWVARYSDTSHYRDVPSELVGTSSGGCIATGRSSRGTASSDLATVCYDSSGNEEWVRRYSGPRGGIDHANAVALAPPQSAYVAGYVTGDTWRQGVVLKYDMEGTLDWAALYRPPGENACYHSITIDQAGNLVATGYQGPVYTKFLTVKYNPSGETLWTRLHYRGTGVDVQTDEEDNVYVVGTDNQTGSTADIVLLKYEPDGTEEWVARYDGPDQREDWGYDLALGPGSSVYVCGSSESEVFGSECILIRYSTSGDTVWTARSRGEGRYGTVANAVTVDVEGNVIVAGSINKSSTGNDYLVAKYPPSGPGIAEGPSRPVPRHGVNVLPSVARSTCLLTGNACSDGYRFLISDMSGRIVGRLSSNQPPNNSIQAVWGLDDEFGHQVPNGVYFVTLDAPGQSACAKIIVQR